MTRSEVVIQPMASEDIPACVQIITENELWKLYSVTPHSAEQMFISALAGGAKLIVAKLDGQTAGFAWCVLHGAWDRSAYLRLIGVLPAFQRLGIGDCLLQAVEEMAARVVQDIFLLVTDSNTAGQRFYLRSGYSQVGAIPDYVVKGITELVFYKRLSG
jgi:ribosomal protein S18 acetylase RimI-like enzyme